MAILKNYSAISDEHYFNGKMHDLAYRVFAALLLDAKPCYWCSWIFHSRWI